MKRLFYFLVFVFTLIVNANSQNYEGIGMVYNDKGDTIKGKVVYLLSRPDAVKVILDNGEEKVTDFNFVNGFTIGDRIYDRIKIKVIGNPNIFALRLSDKNSRIKVYLYEEGSKSSDGNYYVSKTCYINVGENEYFYTMTDLRFTPIGKKFSKIVADCPELSDKLTKKEKGYSLGLTATNDMKIDLLQRISKEYDMCK